MRKIGLPGSVFRKEKPLETKIGELKNLFDIDFVEIRPQHHSDIDYIGQRKGDIYFKKKCMKYIKDCCQDLQFQLHFRDIYFGKIKTLCTGEKDIVKFLLDVAEATNKYFDDFVLITHLMYSKKGFQDISVKEAIKNAKRGLKEIYKNWDFSGKFALETTMEPFVYKDAALLGYKPQHLEYLIQDKQDKIGICIDTGHLNGKLNQFASFNDFIHLPIYEIHFHGNHSHRKEIDDLHTLPRRATLEDYDVIMDYLKNYEGMINVEVRNMGTVKWLQSIVKELN